MESTHCTSPEEDVSRYNSNANLADLSRVEHEVRCEEIK